LSTTAHISCRPKSPVCGSNPWGSGTACFHLRKNLEEERLPHFVEDYQRLVNHLIETYPLDEAMSIAVGGSYEKVGNVAADIVIYAGARDGMSVLDFGCGSGRVAHALSNKIHVDRFLGIDVVQKIMDYAKTKTPQRFEFKRNIELSIPAEGEFFDLAYSLSVFMRLQQNECFLYFADIARTLKRGGTLVVSFLEFSNPQHWVIFEGSLKGSPHMNTFIERSQWEVWASHVGLTVREYIGGSQAISPLGTLGQSVLIFDKR
jgi:ubiquinone/menaquinone biosynthesis C-methylase UbiE